MPLSTERGAPCVPPRFKTSSLSGFDMGRSKASKTAFDAAIRMYEGEITNLVLIGPTGAGKTHLAAAIVNAQWSRERTEYEDALDAAPDARGLAMSRHPRRPVSAEWANVADLIVTMRADMDRPLDDRSAMRTVARLRDWPLIVVLDDLGREKASDWTAETIYSLVNHRYEAMLPTIVTSNLTPSDLSEGPYWPAISRLAEGGRLIDMAGTPDHRLVR